MNAQEARRVDDSDEMETVRGSVTERQRAEVRYDQPWLTSFFRPFLISLAVTCINIALLAFVQRFLRVSPPFAQLMIMMGIFAAVTGCITTTLLAQPGERTRRSGGYRVAEIALFVILVRLLVWVVVGNWPTLASLLTRPLDNLLDGYFVAAAVVTFLSWLLASGMTASLQAMALQADELYMLDHAHDHRRESARVIHSDRGQILRGFVARWVIGGLFLVILAAGSRMDLPQNGFFAILHQRIDPLVIGAVIVYFLSGLILISQGQLAMLRARWALEDTPSRAGVLEYWSTYVLIYVVTIGVVASLLPFGGTFRLAQILSWIFQAIYFVVFGIMQLFSLIVLFILSLFSSGAESTAPPPPAEAPIVPPPVEEVVSPNLEWLGGLTFWIIAAVLIAYAASVYFRDRGITLHWLLQFWRTLRSRWQRLAQNLRGNSFVSDDDGSPAEADSVFTRMARMFQRGRYTDRAQQLRYYYLNILARAARAGVERQQGETPYAYAPRLAQTLADEPESVQGFHGLTEEFVRIRYGQAIPEADQMGHWERAWKQIRRQLSVRAPRPGANS